MCEFEGGLCLCVIFFIQGKRAICASLCALTHVRGHLCLSFYVCAEGLPAVLVLITDGKANGQVDPISASAAIKERGITIVAVGIGDEIDLNELNAIASDPTDVFNITVS